MTNEPTGKDDERAIVIHPEGFFASEGDKEGFVGI